ncbi:MAG: hypothetical protein GQ569_06140 [Methylococcaceae bacterium]|nr:hypothetical protein [Methylococcaceae bacterium]
MNRLNKLMSLIVFASLVSACFPVPIFIPSDDDAAFFPIFIPIPVPIPKTSQGEGEGESGHKSCKLLDCKDKHEELPDDYRRELYQKK